MTEEEALDIAKRLCKVEHMGDLNRFVTELFSNNSIPIKFKGLDKLPRAIKQYECDHKNTFETEQQKICLSCNKILEGE